MNEFILGCKDRSITIRYIIFDRIAHLYYDDYTFIYTKEELNRIITELVKESDNLTVEELFDYLKLK